MTDDPHNTSGDLSDHNVVETKEDAETAAAREELKHTAISEKEPDTTDDIMVTTRSGRAYEKGAPDLAPAEPSRERALSPKKKRARDEVDEHKDAEEHASGGQAVKDATGCAVTTSSKDRAEPQKKRARDETSPPADIHKKPLKDAAASPPNTSAKSVTDTKDAATDSKEKDTQPKAASASAFAASGFSKLASSTASPFASLGANKSVFGGGGGGGASSSPSPFASLAAKPPQKPAAPTPTLSFGNGDKSGTTSPFASLNGPSKGFGGGFGGSPFGSAMGTGKITNFGKPGVALKNDKPARPFGAPVSDAEDDDDEADGDNDDEDGAETSEKEKDDVDKDDSKSTADDGKAAKYKKVFVDSGEEGEVTILQARTKMYYLDKSVGKDGKEETAWKERGAGNLKINVPRKTVEIDETTDAVFPDTFDASMLDDGSSGTPKVVRLILRQDSTHRVILNTALLPSMTFTEKEGFKATSILFTAIEGKDAKPVQVQMKMNNKNAESFIEQVQKIQKEMLSMA